MKEVTIKKMYQIIRKAGLMPDMETEAQFRKYILYLQNKTNPLRLLGGKLHITVDGIEYKLKEVENESNISNN